MRRPRPYVPISTRIVVALKQCERKVPFEQLFEPFKSVADMLDRTPEQVHGGKTLLDKLLATLFPDNSKYHLDHDPPLAARQFNSRTGKYTPAANDPAYLIYRKAEDHRIKTLIRGEHGQYSDIALIKRERRRAKPKRQRLKNMKQRRHRRYLAQKRRYALMRRLKEEK